MNNGKIFHVSEEAGITVFNPRPSPSYYESIHGNVVFGISGKLVHNYLLPRDCPRVTYYAQPETSQDDIDRFIRVGEPEFVVAIESKWYPIVRATPLFCYELPVDKFVLLDKGAGYHISYKPVEPVSVRRIDDVLGELLKRNVELRIMPRIRDLAEAVSKSSLQFSLIRMRNAMK